MIGNDGEEDVIVVDVIVVVERFVVIEEGILYS
jgi:hypothetical protein